MGRLIEVRNVVDLPAVLVVQVGDLLLFRATGGRIQSGAAVTKLGSFMAGTLTDDGEVLSAVVAPDATLFAASEPGRALRAVYRRPVARTPANDGDGGGAGCRRPGSFHVTACGGGEPPHKSSRSFSIPPNVGDQQNDLDGGFAEKAFRVHNPFCFIP